MKLNILRIFLVLFLFLREETGATNCYQCNSKRDDGCTISKVDSKYLKPCPPTQPYCRKAVYKYYFADSGEYFIVRECAKWKNVEKVCYRGRYKRDSYQLVCECNGAGCNRSAKSFPDLCVPVYVLCQLLIFLVLNPT